MRELDARDSGFVIDRLDHLVLTVHDLQRTIAFYEKVLGMEVVRFGDGLGLHRRNRQNSFRLSARPGSKSDRNLELCST